jgi:hypothetical protein
MYRQLGEDYRHHLRWRERLFVGFLVVIGTLALAFYHTHKNGDCSEPWFAFGWTIPLAGFVLSLTFFVLDRRCHEVLLGRRDVGRAFEERAMRVGLFGSAGDKAKVISHSRTLWSLYLFSAFIMFVIFVGDICNLGGDIARFDLCQWVRKVLKQ